MMNDIQMPCHLLPDSDGNALAPYACVRFRLKKDLEECCGVPAGKAVTAKQARLKKEEAEKCTEENAAACYDHTGNIGIGPVKVRSSTGVTLRRETPHFQAEPLTASLAATCSQPGRH